MEYLTVGRIVRTVGLKGEVKVYPSTHFRDSRFSKGNHVFLLENGAISKDLTIKSHRKNGDCDHIIFDDISTIEEAELYVGQELFVEKDYSFLKKDNYFYSDLEKMSVFFDNGKLIGKVKKVEEFSSYATLRVETNEKDALIPFVKAFIEEVNLEEGKIIVKFIEGLV